MSNREFLRNCACMVLGSATFMTFYLLASTYHWHF